MFPNIQHSPNNFPITTYEASFKSSNPLGGQPKNTLLQQSREAAGILCNHTFSNCTFLLSIGIVAVLAVVSKIALFTMPSQDEDKDL